MKRSEMIALLAEDLSENHGLDFLTDYPEVVAKAILDLLESKGMLPPLHIFKDQHEDYCATYDNDECTCNPFRDNQWEPEE